MDGFTIRSCEGRASLVLTYASNEEWTADLVGPSVTARRSVYAYSPHGAMDKLFAAMAHQWRGWSGPMTWRSLEGELSLTCTSDGLGHIAIDVELVMNWDCSWRVKGRLTVEAGQLEALAAQARAFVDTD